MGDSFLFELASDGQIRFVSASVAALTGYHPEDLTGQNWWTVFFASQGRRYVRSLMHKMGTGEVNRLAVTLDTRQGALMVEITCSPRNLSDGVQTIVGYASTIAPPTQVEEEIQKYSEESWRESEERYRTIFETAAVSIWEQDFSEVKAAIDALKAQGVTDFYRYLDQHPEFVTQVAQMIKVRDINQTTLKMFEGRDKAEMMGALDKIIVPETMHIIHDEIIAMAEGESHFEGETVNHTLQGRPLDILLSMTIPSDPKKFDSVLISTMDITARKQAEHMLRQSEKKYRELHQNLRDGVAAVDKNGMILEFNAAFRDMLGYTADEIYRLTYKNITPDKWHTKEAEILKTQVDRLGYSTPYEKEYRRKDGSQFPVELITYLARDVNGVPAGYWAFVRDITKRKKAETELSRLYRASGALLSAAVPDLKSVAQTVADTVLSEFGQSNCSVLLVQQNTLEVKRIAVAGVYAEEVNKSKLRLDSPGLATQAIRTKQIINTPDVTVQSDHVPNWAAARSDLVIPLQTGERVIGAIEVQSANPAAFSADDERLMSIFAERAVLALENARLFEESQRRAREFMSLYETSSDLAGVQDLHTLLKTIIERASLLLDIPYGCFYLYDAASGEMEVTVEKGGLGVIGTRLKLGEGMAGVVAQTRQPMIVEDYQSWKDRSHHYDALHLTSVLELPMLYAGELIGVLVVYELAPVIRRFSDADVHLLSLFAAQAAAAVHSARQLDQTLHRLAEMEAVSRVSSALRAAETLGEMLPILLDETLAVIDTQAGAILLCDATTRQVTQAAARGWPAQVNESPSPARYGNLSDILTTNQPYYVKEFASDPFARQTFGEKIPAGWGGVCIPIRTTYTVIGVLLISVQSPRQLGTQQISLLSTLAEIAGNALHRTRLHLQTEVNLRRITALRAIDLAINSSADLHVTLDIILGQVISQLGVDAADVFLLSPYTHSLEYATGRGFSLVRQQHPDIPLGQGYAGRAALDRRALLIKNILETRNNFDLRSDMVDEHTDTLITEDGFVGYYGVPLIAKGDVKGVLEIFQRTPLNPDREWLAFLENLVGQAAIAIDNASLFENLQRSNMELTLAYDTVLEGWAHALELCQIEPHGHCRRVSDLSVQIMRNMKARESEQLHLQRGALLHDVGMMTIPETILTKPGPLNKSEWNVIQQHPAYALEMLSPIAYLRSSLDIPYCHHEKWDGSGYPRGLKGDEIPLGARVFTLVDMWDLLHCERSYRKAWPEDKILAYIRSQAGIYFDPQVVESFFNLFNRQRHL